MITIGNEHDVLSVEMHSREMQWYKEVSLCKAVCTSYVHSVGKVQRSEKSGRVQNILILISMPEVFLRPIFVKKLICKSINKTTWSMLHYSGI